MQHGATWTRPASIVAAAELAGTGMMPVGGGTLLMSKAFDVGRGPYVDLRDVLSASCADGRFGAMATLSDVAIAAVGRWPAVVEAILQTANPGVRRLATIGGTVSARLPGCDLAAPLAAYDALVVTVDEGGQERTLPFMEFWAQPGRGHIVTEVILGSPAFGAYRRHSGRSGPAPALASVAGLVSDDGIHLWAGAVTDVPICLDEGFPNEGDLLDDARCSRQHRLRLLRALSDEVMLELNQANSEADLEPEIYD